MSMMGRHLVDLGYEYLESHNLSDSDENWEKAMKAICEGENDDENAE